MWAIGLGEKNKLPLELIILMATVVITITLLILFSYAKNKSDSLKTRTGLFSITFVLVTLVWLAYSFFLSELSLLGILLLITYIITGILLLLNIVREITSDTLQKFHPCKK